MSPFKDVSSTVPDQFARIGANNLPLSPQDLNSVVNFNFPLAQPAKSIPRSLECISVIVGHWCSLVVHSDRGNMHLTMSHTTFLLRCGHGKRADSLVSIPNYSLGAGWAKKPPAVFVMWIVSPNRSGFWLLLHVQSTTTWELWVDSKRLRSCCYPITCWFPYI